MGATIPTSVDLSIVIVSFNTKELLRKCLESITYESQGIPSEIIVVDNHSHDGSAEMVATSFPSVVLITTAENLGFAGANNKGFAVAKGRYIVLLNSDAFLYPGTLHKALELMELNPDVGLAGARLIGSDGSWQPSRRMYPSVLNDFLHLSGLAAKYPQSHFFGRADRTWVSSDVASDADWVPGAFAIIRREALEKSGYFDERFFLYYEEVDLCRRIKGAGFRIVYWPDLVVTHLGGESSKNVRGQLLSSSGTQLTLWRIRSGFLYYRKHHGYWGARSAMLMELLWHKMRKWKNYCLGTADKAKDSQIHEQLLLQAWKETEGGLVSPPRPW